MPAVLVEVVLNHATYNLHHAPHGAALNPHAAAGPAGSPPLRLQPSASEGAAAAAPMEVEAAQQQPDAEAAGGGRAAEAAVGGWQGWSDALRSAWQEGAQSKAQAEAFRRRAAGNGGADDSCGAQPATWAVYTDGASFAPRVAVRTVGMQSRVMQGSQPRRCVSLSAPRAAHDTRERFSGVLISSRMVRCLAAAEHLGSLIAHLSTREPTEAHLRANLSRVRHGMMVLSAAASQHAPPGADAAEAEAAAMDVDGKPAAAAAAAAAHPDSPGVMLRPSPAAGAEEGGAKPEGKAEGAEEEEDEEEEEEEAPEGAWCHPDVWGPASASLGLSGSDGRRRQGGGGGAGRAVAGAAAGARGAARRGGARGAAGAVRQAAGRRAAQRRVLGQPLPPGAARTWSVVLGAKGLAGAWAWSWSCACCAVGARAGAERRGPPAVSSPPRARSS